MQTRVNKSLCDDGLLFLVFDAGELGEGAVHVVAHDQHTPLLRPCLYDLCSTPVILYARHLVNLVVSKKRRIEKKIGKLETN